MRVYFGVVEQVCCRVGFCFVEGIVVRVVCFRRFCLNVNGECCTLSGMVFVTGLFWVVEICVDYGVVYVFHVLILHVVYGVGVMVMYVLLKIVCFWRLDVFVVL